MTASAEVQKGVYDALTAALSVTVSDDHDQDIDPPFVVVGNDAATPSDVKEANGIEHRIQIDVFSDYGGFKEVKQLVDQIYQALHRQRITVAGYESTELQFDFHDYISEPTGRKHGVVFFTLQTSE